MNTKKFWSRVKACIKEKGITQEIAAKGCRFSYGTFRNWIYRNVNPPLTYANRISNYLGVSLDYLISGQKEDSFSKTQEEVLVLLKQAEEKIRKLQRGG